MTYPDRELARDQKRLALWIAIIALIVAAFILEQTFRDRVCISAAQVDSTGTVTSTPVTCS